MNPLFAAAAEIQTLGEERGRGFCSQDGIDRLPVTLSPALTPASGAKAGAGQPKASGCGPTRPASPVDSNDR